MVRVQTLDLARNGLSESKLSELYVFCNALMAESRDSFRLSTTQCEVAYVFYADSAIVGVSFWRTKPTADPSHVAIVQGVSPYVSFEKIEKRELSEY